MINKKVSKILGPVAGIMSFMIAMGSVSIPACAAETTIAQSADVNYEINQNGVKFKVTNIVGTKHKVKIDAVIERKEGFKDLDERNLHFNLYMDKTQSNSGSASWGISDKNTIRIECEDESKEGFPETGNIRADLVMGEYDFNGSLVIPVDFSESFKKVMEKDLNEKVSDDISIVKFESDAIGTRIIVNKPTEKVASIRDLHNDATKYIIKVDDKIYTMSHMNSTNDDTDNLSYEFEDLTYEDVKDAEKISIVPIICNIKSNDMENYYKNNIEDFINSKVTSDNVKYNKEISFEDGTKGEIKVERCDGKIKLYCSSNSDKNSLLMASGIDGVYTGDNDEDVSFSSINKPIVYKDTNKEHQYVVQFDDSNKDKPFEVFLDGLISNNDKFEIGNEISVK